MWPDGAGGPVLTFAGDSDAHIVRGLIAILFAVYSGNSAREFLITDAVKMFEGMGCANFSRPSAEWLPFHGGEDSPTLAPRPCSRLAESAPRRTKPLGQLSGSLHGPRSLFLGWIDRPSVSNYRLSRSNTGRLEGLGAKIVPDNKRRCSIQKLRLSAGEPLFARSPPSSLKGAPQPTSCVIAAVSLLDSVSALLLRRFPIQFPVRWVYDKVANYQPVWIVSPKPFGVLQLFAHSQDRADHLLT